MECASNEIHKNKDRTRIKQNKPQEENKSLSACKRHASYERKLTRRGEEQKKTRLSDIYLCYE